MYVYIQKYCNTSIYIRLDIDIDIDRCMLICMHKEN